MRSGGGAGGDEWRVHCTSGDCGRKKRAYSGRKGDKVDVSGIQAIKTWYKWHEVEEQCRNENLRGKSDSQTHVLCRQVEACGECDQMQANMPGAALHAVFQRKWGLTWAALAVNACIVRHGTAASSDRYVDSVACWWHGCLRMLKTFGSAIRGMRKFRRCAGRGAQL